MIKLKIDFQLNWTTIKCWTDVIAWRRAKWLTVWRIAWILRHTLPVHYHSTYRYRLDHSANAGSMWTIVSVHPNLMLKLVSYYCNTVCDSSLNWYGIRHTTHTLDYRHRLSGTKEHRIIKLYEWTTKYNRILSERNVSILTSQYCSVWVPLTTQQHNTDRHLLAERGQWNREEGVKGGYDEWRAER